MKNHSTQRTVNVATFLTQSIRVSGKTPDELAAALGFANGNAVRRMPDGMVKLPIAKIEEVAQALNVDASRLFRLTVAEYYPGLLETFDRLAGSTIVTENERRLLTALREQTGDGDAQAIVCDARSLVAVVMV